MLDPKEEKRFDELKAMCRELKVPAPPEIMIGLKVHDKNGVLVFDDVQRGHSWTRNFWNTMFSMMTTCGSDGTSSFGAGYMTGKSTDTTLRNTTNRTAITSTPAIPAAGFVCDGANASSGTVVGTGDTAFSVEQTALAALVAHGNTAGTLYYQAQLNTTKAYIAGSKTWTNTTSRIFNNNSGGSITVKEVGLYWLGQMFASINSAYLFERSVLSPTVAVANGAQLTVTYQISMDFSAID